MIDTDNRTQIFNQEMEKLMAGKSPAETIDELQKRLLEAENNCEHRFETIFDESAFGNKIIDANLKIVKANKKLTELLGYSKKELLGTLITDIAHPDFLEDWQRLQEELWSLNRPSFSIDTCLIKKDQSVVWCHISSIVFKDNGETYGYTTLEDISERKHLERMRDEIDIKKDEFIGIVSHELRTPLSTIKMINQLLEKSVSKDQSYYSFITKSNRHIIKLEHLITDLLDLTKIKSGHVQLKITDFNLGGLLDDCIAGLISINPTHHIVFKKDYDGNILADEFRIEQVLINFVNNAIKYSPDAKEIIVSLTKDEDKVMINIEDFGIGIDDKHIKQIFDRFYRVEEVSNHFQGLGLGLYISSQIISQHGGQFGITSQLGKGSNFWFSLPISNPVNVNTPLQQ